MLLNLVALCLALVASQAEYADELTQDVVDAFVDEHNRVRADVGVGQLTWDEDLSDYAASHGSDCTFEHSGGPYGENLYASSEQTTDNVAIAVDSVKVWEAEIDRVDWPDWTCARSDDEEYTCGHYSQIVWANTLSVGCAIIKCDPEDIGIGDYVVCEYSPSGNYEGETPY